MNWRRLPGEMYVLTCVLLLLTRNALRTVRRCWCLQAVSLGLGTVVVGAFDDGKVERLWEMQDDERALCIMPVGRV
jgi:nitroreductase